MAGRRTWPSMIGAERHRVVQTIVRTSNGESSLASGYLVSDGVVLTAAHVVRRAQETEQITVRFSSWANGGTSVTVRECLRDGGGSDLAVLTLTTPAGFPFPNPVRYAGLGGPQTELAARIHGYPRWRQRPIVAGAVDGPTRREYVDVAGRILLSSADARGRYDFELVGQAPRAVSQGSPWSAMSGGPVWVGRDLVAVVAEHHRAEGDGRLAITGIDGAYDVEPGWIRSRMLGLLKVPARRFLSRALSPPPLGNGAPTPFVRFVIVRDGQPGLPLVEGVEMCIGRSELSDIIINDDLVSEQHCRLWMEVSASTGAVRPQVVDLSTNGTSVNGHRLDRLVPTVLADGDELSLGRGARLRIRAIQL